MLLTPLKLGDHVVLKGTEKPIGIIEAMDYDIVIVRWGTADDQTFRSELLNDALELAPFEIVESD